MPFLLNLNRILTDDVAKTSFFNRILTTDVQIAVSGSAATSATTSAPSDSTNSNATQAGGAQNIAITVTTKDDSDRMDTGEFLLYLLIGSIIYTILLHLWVKWYLSRPRATSDFDWNTYYFGKRDWGLWGNAIWR